MPSLKSLLAQVVKFLSNAGDRALIAKALDAILPVSVRPFAKAIIPAALTLVAVLVNSLAAGFDAVSVAIALTGLLGSVVAYLVPNHPATISVVSKPVSAPPAAPPSK